MEIEFFGAAGEVTGSCHILRFGGHTVLLDCGLIQGSRKAEARLRRLFTSFCSGRGQNNIVAGRIKVGFE